MKHISQPFNPILVEPIIDPKMRNLCQHPYELHPKGCPNFGKYKKCPPLAPLFNEVYDLNLPVWAIVNEFNLENHVKKMRTLHPTWSNRQLRCVLYWQGTARKQLTEKINEAMSMLKITHLIMGLEPRAETCPEAMGVNVTETLKNVGIILEWMPVKIARQVALIASLRRR